MYDSTWAVALALHNVSEQLERGNYSRRLEDFTYKDREMALMIRDSTQAVDFEGTTVAMLYSAHKTTRKLS